MNMRPVECTFPNPLSQSPWSLQLIALFEPHPLSTHTAYHSPSNTQPGPSAVVYIYLELRAAQNCKLTRMHIYGLATKTKRSGCFATVLFCVYFDSPRRSTTFGYPKLTRVSLETEGSHHFELSERLPPADDDSDSLSLFISLCFSLFSRSERSRSA